MAEKTLDDVVDELQALGRQFDSLADILRDDSRKDTQATSASTSASVVAAAAPAGKEASSEQSKADLRAVKSQVKFRQANRNAASKIGADFLRSASNPLTPVASAGLSAGENLLAVIAGSVAGEKGAEAASALVNAGANQLLGKQRFALDNTVQDLQGTLSTLADMGIDPSNDQIDDYTRSFQARAKRKYDLLKRGKESINRVTGGQLLGLEKESEKRDSLLKQIADNTSKDGGGKPDADLRGD